jgi:hypothetical protein
VAAGLLLCDPGCLYRRGAQGTGCERDDTCGRQATAAGFRLGGPVERGVHATSDADAFALNELSAIGLRSIAPGQPAAPTAAQNRTQIAMAVTDANCTQSTDLAGIYFAVQASYEQQFVTANQQALNVAVRRYQAAFASQLSKLPALLRTASAKLNLPGGPRKRAGLGHPSKPGSSPSQPGG